MRAILIRCPECGAKLSVSATDKETSCEYCGARSQIQHRRGLLERTAAPPAGASKLPFAVQRHSMAWRLGIIGIPTLFVGVGFFVAIGERAERQATLAAANAQQASVVPSMPAPVKKAPPTRPTWRSQGAALVDINGDEKLDVIGRVHLAKPVDEEKFVAFDGVSGDSLWTGDDLDLPADSSPWPFAIAEQSLLFPQSKTLLRAFSIVDGAEQWSITLPEALGLTCKSDSPGTVILQTADKAWHRLKLADGAIEPLDSAVPPPCQPLAGDSAYLSRAGQLQVEPPFSYPKLAPENPEGLNVRRAIYNSQSEIMVALAEKSPGTAIPTLVGYQRDQIADRIRHGGLFDLRTAVTSATRKLLDPEIRKLEKTISKSKADLLWTAPLPSTNPTEAQAGAPSNRNLALQGEVVVAAYTGSSKLEYLTAFSTKDGSRLWEVELKGVAALSRLVATESSVYAVRSSGVEVFRLEDGEAVYILPPLPPE